jgi:hypothetical protein
MDKHFNHNSQESRVTFPQIRVTQLNEFLGQRQTQGKNEVIRAVRRFIQNLG